MAIEIEDIDDSELKKLALSALRDASSTIGNDLHDALASSETNEELITNWQSALEDLKDEAEHYWNALEKMKRKG